MADYLIQYLHWYRTFFRSPSVWQSDIRIAIGVVALDRSMHCAMVQAHLLLDPLKAVYRSREIRERSVSQRK